MPILAIESASSDPGVALVDGESILAVEAAEAGAPGSEALLPAIARLLQGHGLAIADLDGFAIGIGPGSFTGLRVGLATLKGLAFGDSRLVAPVSTLAALARLAGVPRSEAVVAALDARRGDAYAALWENGEATEPVLPESVYRLDDLVARLPDRCVWVGDSVGGYPEAAGGGVRAGPTGPCAGQVGLLGARILAAGGGVPAAELIPRYLRRAEAEVQRTGQALEPH